MSVKISWRVGLDAWLSDEQFDHLSTLLLTHRSAVDEVALFETRYMHQYVPMDVYAGWMTVLSGRLAALKRLGIASVGVDIHGTIGQCNEGWDFLLKLAAPMIGRDGTAAFSAACPNAPETRAYLQRRYTCLTQSHPDFIWVDDDIRMCYHSIDYGCFCPVCLALFSERTGREWRREELVQALNVPEHRGLREAWQQQLGDTLASLYEFVGQTIRAVSPDQTIGIMTNGPDWGIYNGWDYQRNALALGAVKGRPGSGFYSDRTPVEMLTKIYEMGRQRAAYPEQLTDLQYELENFIYDKSSRAVASECTLALAVGMNGIAFNALSPCGRQHDAVKYLELAMAERSIWSRLIGHAAGLPTVGLWPAWHRQVMGRRTVRAGEDWFDPSRHNSTRPYAFGEVGVPLGVDADAATGVVFSGRMPEAFSDDELRRILSGGVLLDAQALEVLWERGFGALTGVKISRWTNNGVREIFTDDPLNGEFAGESRDCHIDFSGASGNWQAVLTPVKAGVRSLAVMQNYNYVPETYGACLTAYENELGGRVAVMGYCPWTLLDSSHKRTQVFNLADWVCHGRLPVKAPATLVPIIRMNAARSRGALVLLNASLDEVKEATVVVRAPSAANVRQLCPDGECLLETQPVENGWSVRIKPLAPWAVACILFD